jgi:peptide deformylase
LLDVVEYPHDILDTPCDPVVEFDHGLKHLVEQMVETMYAQHGVGLAAPQVGVSCRVLVMDPSGGEEGNQLRVLINPEVTWRSPEQESRDEGCLSMPGMQLKVLRPVAVEVKYFDLEGKEHQVQYGEWLARIVQHESDHLDGVMMIDRVGTMQRKLALKSLGKKR